MELDLLNLLFVLIAAWIAGAAATRMGYPAVLGELIAGIVLGPPVLGLLHGSEGLAVLADVGILLMMLYIGMEIDPAELGKASWAGLLAAVGGFAVPFVMAYTVIIWFGGTQLAGLFVGIAAGITSLATKSRILVDLHLLDTRIAHVLMAGALISDTLALLAFAAIMGVVDVGTVELGGIALVALKAVLFFVVTAFIGLRFFPYIGRKLAQLHFENRTFHFTLILITAVGFGELAELAGLHAILGAFIAGLFLRDNVLGRTLASDLMGAVREASIGFLAPIFFVTAGFAVTFSVFQANLALFLSIMAVAIFGKVVGTTLFYLPTGYGWREGLAVGAGMNGRGAVEIIVAGIGLQMGLISNEIFSILVFMAIFTTAAVPLFLKWGTDWLRRRGELVRSTEDRSGAVIIGAGPLARSLAGVLSQTQRVCLVDSNPERCQLAEADGLRVVRGNALEEQTLSEAGAGHASIFAAMIANPKVNSLSAQMARNVFQIPEILVVQNSPGSDESSAAMDHLHAHTLFGGPVEQEAWDHWISHDESVQSNVPAREFGSNRPESILNELLRTGDHLPLAVKRNDTFEPFHSSSKLEAENEIVILTSRRPDVTQAVRDRFDRLTALSPIIDIDRSMDHIEFFQLAAFSLADLPDADPDALTESLLDREELNSSVIAPGLAVPHALIDGERRFRMLIARSRDGIRFPSQEETVHAVFLLLRTQDERTFHLRALSAIAQVVQDADFEEKWMTARNSEDLRSIILSATRRRFPEFETS
jgi:Kef-type K+ transport system membrane component KefB/Trk K+ transport system NAD-binding subunit/mannitol/fructose-specific phosphotransferase system IIA component (Ntr-type)